MKLHILYLGDQALLFLLQFFSYFTFFCKLFRSRLVMLNNITIMTKCQFFRKRYLKHHFTCAFRTVTEVFCLSYGDLSWNVESSLYSYHSNTPDSKAACSYIYFCVLLSISCSWLFLMDRLIDLVDGQCFLCLHTPNKQTNDHLQFNLGSIKTTL